MTNFKKVTAVLLSLLMMLGMFTVLGSAVEYDDDTGAVIVTESPATIDIDVRFFDADGAAIPDLGAVAPGSTVKARVFLGTNYYSGSAQLRLYYPTAFFTDSYATNVRYDLTDSPNPMNAENSAISADAVKSIGIKHEGTFSGEEAIKVALYANNAGDTFVYDGSTWLFELELQVKSDASGLGYLTAKASDFYFFEDDELDVINSVDYGYQNDSISDTVELWMANGSDFDITVDSDEITTQNTVTFNANGGSFGEDGPEATTISGTVNNVYSTPLDTVRKCVTDQRTYTFTGWYEDEDCTVQVLAADATEFTMPVEQGVVYYAGWIDNVVISFEDTGDEAVADREVTGGSEWAAADKPVVTKQGYKFMGWEGVGVVDGELPANYPAATDDVYEYTYTAIWAKNVVITFDANGGTFTDGNAGTYGPSDDIYTGAAWDTSVVPKYDVSNYAAAGVSKTGYGLIGWNDGNGTITQFPTAYPADDTTYTAVWQAYNVYVTYVVDGETVAMQVVPYSVGGVNLKTVADVAEWHYGAPDGTAYAPGDAYSFIEADLNGVTFYGVSEETGTVTATFDANGGKFADDSTSKDVVTDKGTAPVAPAAPSREGYTFIGWTPAVGTISADTTYTAVWEEDATLVIYVDYDDTEIERFTQAYGEEIEAPADPEREGYTFVGWIYTDSNDETYTGNTVPAGGLTGKADYIVNTYKITYDVDGGVYTDPDFDTETEVAYDAAIPADPAATKQGYKPNPAWAYADEDGVAYTGTTMPAFDLVATAQWEKDQFTITFESNGGTAVTSITDDFEASIAKPEDPTKAGQTFAGWYYDENLQDAVQWPVSMPAEDITLYAKWGNNIINIKFMDGTDQLYNLSDEFGETVNYDSIVTDRPGYTFDGWFDTAAFDNLVTLPATYPENDLTVYGKWTANEYTITYAPNGGTWADGKTGVETITYDALPTLPTADDITLEGYSFGGVYIDDGTFSTRFIGTDYTQIFDNATQIDGNQYEMTVYIKWDINSYNAVFYSDGEVFRTVPYNYNAPVSAPVDEPFKDSYTFLGWAATDNATAADVIDFATAGITMPVGGLTYYAVFERNAVTVNFYAYGERTPLGEYDEEHPLTGSGTYDIGADLDLSEIEAPAYANFEFVGWVTGDGDEYGADEIISVEDAMDIYAVYERVAVKLVPTDENSTAMIERDGVVETWNTDLTTTPFGVTEIKTPNAQAYSATEYDAYYVYGLKTRLTEAELAEYVKVQGDGHYEVTLSSMSAYGTGAIIKVIDNVTNETVEQFYIVIYGDINGDAIVTTTDTNLYITEVKNTDWSGTEGRINYLVKAADLNKDGLVTSTDTSVVIDVVKETLAIDQKVGLAS